MQNRTVVIPAWVQQISARIEIHISHGEWEHAHAIIDRTRLERMHELLPVSQVARLALPLADVGLSQRLCNKLEELEIITVHDLLDSTEQELMALRNFGEAAMAECLRALARMGFK